MEVWTNGISPENLKATNSTLHFGYGNGKPLDNRRWQRVFDFPTVLDFSPGCLSLWRWQAARWRNDPQNRFAREPVAHFLRNGTGSAASQQMDA